MKNLFKNVEIKQSNKMSKKDIKQLNKLNYVCLDLKLSYTQVTLKNRVKIIKNNEGKALYFEYFNKVYPTVENFDRKLHKTVLLDEGALGPLNRGADVMIPGIIKYKDKIEEFEKDEIVGIEIETVGIFAVGKTLFSLKEMINKNSGVGIEVYNLKSDKI
ncbi:MCTS1 [Hepatospora eriocheir]|uniref:MCTS1 n=1 Tax=Hepatospora eriocheir TaxID=1081669 RepID=A0A1X0QEA0_9MICR|nr:MCTS1 [Hepatospora eriocheir]